MVNENVQAVINLAGKGFASRALKTYREGEYSELMNAEITPDGTIKARPTVFAALEGGDAAATYMVKPRGFIGQYGKYAVLGEYTKNRFCSKINQIYSPYEYVLNSASSFSRPVHFVRYNNRNYWVDHQAIVGAVSTPFVSSSALRTAIIVRGENVDTPPNNPAAVKPYAVLANHTTTTVATGYQDLAVANSADTTFMFKTALVHKNRLWIVTDTTLYFSKATDFNVWAVPDGGFIRFPDQTINYAVSLGNTIYVICDSSVYTVTYSTDPNSVSDLNVQRISSVGGDTAAIYEDTVYFVKNDSLYSISSSTVSKVRDLDFGIESNFKFTGGQPDSLNYRYKVVAWKNYLVILYQRVVNCLHLPTLANKTINKYDTYYVHGEYNVNPATDSNLFFLNMDTGAQYKFHFIDQDGATSVGAVVDICTLDEEDYQNQSRLFLMTSTNADELVDSTSTLNRGNVYTVDATDVLVPADTAGVVTGGNVNVIDYKEIVPRLRVGINRYTPDATSILMKKFRNIFIEGVFPTGPNATFTFGLSFGEYPGLFTRIFNLDDSSAQNNGVDTIRSGLNQRARNISISMVRDRVVNPIPPTLNPALWQIVDFEVTDIRLLWSYTARAITGKRTGPS